MLITLNDVLSTIVRLAQPVVTLDELRKAIDPGQHKVLRLHLGTLFRSGDIMRRNGTDVVFWTKATNEQAVRKGYVTASTAAPTALPEPVVKPVTVGKRISVSTVPRSSDLRARVEGRPTSIPLPIPADGKPFGTLRDMAATGKVAHLMLQLHLLEPYRWYTLADIEHLTTEHIMRGYELRKGELRRVLDALSQPPIVRSEASPYLHREEKPFANRVYTRGKAPFCWRWSNAYTHPWRADLAGIVVPEVAVNQLKTLLAELPVPIPLSDLVQAHVANAPVETAEPVAAPRMVLDGVVAKPVRPRGSAEMMLNTRGEVQIIKDGALIHLSASQSLSLARLLVPHIESDLFKEAVLEADEDYDDDDDDEEFSI